VLCNKKPEIHTGNGGEIRLDFVWMTYMGVTELGFSEWEVNHMYAGKLLDLAYHFKKMHNIRMKRGIFSVVEKTGSLMDL